jgi:hypothetical protein
MSDRNQALLWGIRMEAEGDRPEHWYAGEGETDHYGVLTWDSQTYDEGEALAFQIDGTMQPYLTLGQVLEAFVQERNRVLATMPGAARQAMEGLFSMMGM